MQLDKELRELVLREHGLKEALQEDVDQPAVHGLVLEHVEDAQDAFPGGIRADDVLKLVWREKAVRRGNRSGYYGLYAVAYRCMEMVAINIYIEHVFIQSDLHEVHSSEEGERIYRCWYSKDVHKTKCQALTIWYYGFYIHWHFQKMFCSASFELPEHCINTVRVAV